MGCNYQPHLVSERRISEASTLYEIRKHQESETDNDGRNPKSLTWPTKRRHSSFLLRYGYDLGGGFKYAFIFTPVSGILSWKINSQIALKKHGMLTPSLNQEYISRWWFLIFFMFNRTWGNDPIWLIFFKWVETWNHQLVTLCRLTYTGWISTKCYPYVVNQWLLGVFVFRLGEIPTGSEMSRNHFEVNLSSQPMESIGSIYDILSTWMSCWKWS